MFARVEDMIVPLPVPLLCEEWDDEYKELVEQFDETAREVEKEL